MSETLRALASNLAKFQMTFGEQNTEKEAHEILSYAFENGINTLDTAESQGDVGTQYRSGIYCYNEEQACLANESLNEKQKDFKNKIVAEILPAKRFYKAEEYHQHYLAKGGRAGSKQSAAKGCNDPIRCYG